MSFLIYLLNNVAAYAKFNLGLPTYLYFYDQYENFADYFTDYDGFSFSDYETETAERGVQKHYLDMIASMREKYGETEDQHDIRQ